MLTEVHRNDDRSITAIKLIPESPEELEKLVEFSDSFMEKAEHPIGVVEPEPEPEEEPKE